MALKLGIEEGNKKSKGARRASMVLSLGVPAETRVSQVLERPLALAGSRGTSVVGSSFSK